MSDFKMTPRPEDMNDTGIHRLFDDELRPAIAIKAAMDRLEKIMHQPPEPSNVAELMFHTNKRRRLEFDRVPVGHDLGYRCYDSGKHESAEAAFQAGEYGDGLTEDQAYVDYLHALDDAQPAPRPGITVHSSPFEPPTVVDAIYRDPDED